MPKIREGDDLAGRSSRKLNPWELLIAALIVGAVLAVAQWASPWLLPWVLGYMLASMGNNLRAMCLDGAVSSQPERDNG